MSTKWIRTALEESVEDGENYAEECARAGRMDEHRSVLVRVDRARQALAELEAIEKAAGALVRWEQQGRMPIDADAARGFGVLERIAAEAKARKGGG